MRIRIALVAAASASAVLVHDARAACTVPGFQYAAFGDSGISMGNGNTDSYNSAIASFETRVMVSARKFKELGATSQDADIVELRAIEGGVRRIQSEDK